MPNALPNPESLADTLDAILDVYAMTTPSTTGQTNLRALARCLRDSLIAPPKSMLRGQCLVVPLSLWTALPVPSPHDTR